LGVYIYIEFKRQEENGDPLQYDMIMLLSLNVSMLGNHYI